MTNLENTFGSDFAQKYKSKKQSRQQSRRELPEEDRKKVADMAVNQNGFGEGDPMFDYVDQNGTTHRVMLMELPNMEDKSIFSYARTLDSGAVSIPFDYLGDWISCLFNPNIADHHGYIEEDMSEAQRVKALKRFLGDIPEGGHVVIAGNHEEYVPDDGGDPRDNLSPVTYLWTLEELNEMAEGEMEDQGFGEEDTSDSDAEDDFGSEAEPEVPEEEPPSAQEDGSEEEEDDEVVQDDDLDEFGEEEDEDIFGDEEEDEPEEDTQAGEYDDVPVEDVKELVEGLAKKDDRVWEASPDNTFGEKLTQIAQKRIDHDEGEKIVDVMFAYIEDGDEGVEELVNPEPEEEEGDEEEDFLGDDEEEDEEEDDLLF